MLIHFFPFDKIIRGSNIALFGLGTVGKEYVSEISETCYCNIKFIVDNFINLKEYKNIPIITMDEFIKKNREISSIVIALGDNKLADEIKSELKDNGIEEFKIISSDYIINISNDCALDISQGIYGEAFPEYHKMLHKKGYYVSKIPDSIMKFKNFPEFEEMRIKFSNGDKENLLDSTRLLFFIQNLQHILEKVDGNVAEVGVYKGDTASILSYYCNIYKRKLFLFDTFEGFSDLDLIGIDGEKKKHFGDTSLEKVTNVVGNLDNIHFIKGYFPLSIVDECREKYAFVHLDCDLYNPIKEGLKFFWKLLNKGGMVVIHDYSSGHWEGVTRAVDEFCDEKGLVPILLPDLAGTVVLIKTD